MPRKSTTKKNTEELETKGAIAPIVDIVEKAPEMEEVLLSETQQEEDKKNEKYYESVGRRKESIARVRLFTRKSTDNISDDTKAIVFVNNKPYIDYFKTTNLQNIVESPLKKIKSLNRFKATVMVNGGGMAGQADAIKFGLSRALIMFDPNFAKKLRRAGYLTRDARVKERRKYGLKKARKAPQWSKR